MAFRIKITSQALRDLKAIEQYLEAEGVSDAQVFTGRLLEQAQSLATFPYRHGAWAGQRYIRKVSCDAYIIFYKIHDDDSMVEILRFWHGARDQSGLRLKEELVVGYGNADEEKAHLQAVARRRAMTDKNAIQPGNEALQCARDLLLKREGLTLAAAALG